MRRIYRGEAWIDAPPEAVWAVLVDLDAYPSWNPFTPRVRSTLEVGDPVELTVRLPPWGTRRQVERIRRREAPWALDWGSDFLLGGALVRALRTQRLEPVDGGTRYVTEDVIEGPLAPLVGLLFGRALERGFGAVPGALRREVERRRP